MAVNIKKDQNGENTSNKNNENEHEECISLLEDDSSKTNSHNEIELHLSNEEKLAVQIIKKAKENKIKICELQKLGISEHVLCEILSNRAELFYFISDPACGIQYYKNIINLNSTCNIDDLVYQNLAKLHESNINQQNYKTTYSILFAFDCILSCRVFSRKVMRCIFDNLLYADFTSAALKYKYSVLNRIITMYRVSDKHIEYLQIKRELKKVELTGCHVENKEIQKLVPVLEKASNEIFVNTHGIDQVLFDIYNEDTDTSKDNTMVLANLIWECTFYIVLNFLANKEQDRNNFYTEEDEINDILLIYANIIQKTGKFYEKRIFKNIETFALLQNAKSFIFFYEAIKNNFENIYKFTEKLNIKS